MNCGLSIKRSNLRLFNKMGHLSKNKRTGEKYALSKRDKNIVSRIPVNGGLEVRRQHGVFVFSMQFSFTAKKTY